MTSTSFRAWRRVRLLARALAILALVPFPAAQADVVLDGAQRIISDEPGAGAFGYAVHSLDFDGDGVDELAIADPLETDAGGGARGLVRIYRRTAGGWQNFTRAELNSGTAMFGMRLASGDFDKDGRDDLLIGAPGYGSNGGAVYLLRHIDANTTALANPIAHIGASFGQCGASLAVGDYNNDDNLDFVTGCPSASVDGVTSAGQIQIARGFGNGNFSSESYLSQATTGIADSPESGNRFGEALATGDFNCDGVDDLAVGVPRESVAGGNATGALHVLFGSAPGGLSGADSQFWHQGSTGIPGTSGNNDHFGSALAAANFDGSTHCDDLAIGIPDDAEHPGGAVLVLDASSGGLTATGAKLITVDDLAPDPTGPPHPTPDGNHHIGVSLLAVRLRPTTRTDLAIGVEGYTFFNSTQPGLVCVAQSDGNHPMGAGHYCISGGQFPHGAATDQTFGMAFAVTGSDQKLAISAYATGQVFVLRNVLFADGFESGF